LFSAAAAYFNTLTLVIFINATTPRPPLLLQRRMEPSSRQPATTHCRPRHAGHAATIMAHCSLHEQYRQLDMFWHHAFTINLFHTRAWFGITPRQHRLNILCLWQISRNVSTPHLHAITHYHH